MNAQMAAHSWANRHHEKLIILRECEHEGKKHKHHPDYGKPFEIELLCCKCHGTRRKGSKNKVKYNSCNMDNQIQDKNNNIYLIHLKKIEKDLKTLSLEELAKKIKISYISLYRIKDKRTAGSRNNWEAIFAYYTKRDAL